MAKGTFYHYFASKAEILDALVKRMYAQTLASLEPMLADETLNAVQKLHRFYDVIMRWKSANKDLMVDTFRVLYQDENLLLREKIKLETIRSTTPVLAGIIQQGIAEGVFDVQHPQETAELIIMLPQFMQDSLIAVFIDGEDIEQAKARYSRQIEALNRSAERILGMETGTLTIIEPNVLDQFL